MTSDTSYTVAWGVFGNIKVPQALLRTFSTKFAELSDIPDKGEIRWATFSPATFDEETKGWKSFLSFKFFVEWLYTGRLHTTFATKAIYLDTLWLFGEELGAPLFQNSLLQQYPEQHGYFSENLIDAESFDNPYHSDVWQKLKVNGEVPEGRKQFAQYCKDVVAFKGPDDSLWTMIQKTNQPDAKEAFEEIKATARDAKSRGAPWKESNLQKYLLEIHGQDFPDEGAAVTEPSLWENAAKKLEHFNCTKVTWDSDGNLVRRVMDWNERLSATGVVPDGVDLPALIARVTAGLTSELEMAFAMRIEVAETAPSELSDASTEILYRGRKKPDQ